MSPPLILALPDFVSNSYFPAIAALQLGEFERAGLHVELRTVFPAPACYTALRDGQVDLVAGSAHLPLTALDDWTDMKLLCALSQGMYWFLVMRADLGTTRGDVSAVKGRRIIAAPGIDLGFQQLLVSAGIDAERDDVRIVRLPDKLRGDDSFGVAAARACVAGFADGFWANGMAAAVAVASGDAAVVLDVRRGDGPSDTFSFTAPTLAARTSWVEANPVAAAAAVRAINHTHARLRADPELAFEVAQPWFPPEEARLITNLVRADLPYYRTALSQAFIDSMQRFAMRLNLTRQIAPYQDVVAGVCVPEWES
ncbi:MAG: ABC transporter substrate-binding protein [Pseudomonadota bacterium]